MRLMTTIGILHPGEMGVTIAAGASTETIWAGDGRSPASTARAESAAMSDVGTLAAVCERADIIVSICPPAAAVDVAKQVAATGFDRIYIDANAISPATSIEIASNFSRYIDGGVIGPPATAPGTTRMYLAGPGADEVAEVWTDGPLDARAISDSAETGAASALKMAYAGWTKGQSALLLAVNSLADQAGVLDALRAEWDISQPGLRERSQRVAPAVSRKAWRFSGEMAEIAGTMASAGLEPGFHLAAEALYQRLAVFKDGPEPTLDDVLAALAADPVPSVD